MTALGNALVKTTLAVTDIGRAKKFYGHTLGLKELGNIMGEGEDALYESGHGTQVYLYKRPAPSGSTATACSFEVNDVDGAVKELRGKGVRFEEYDMPEMGLKTVNGVATMGKLKAAWFKDPDGNILAVGNSPLAKTGGGRHAEAQARA